MPLFSNLLLAVVGASGVVLAQGTTPPGPTQPGVPSNCNRWHVVKKGDTCATLESKYSISHPQFLTWNPAVSKDCVTNFWPDYAYCVGVGAVIPTSTTKTTAKTTTTTTRITSPPGPTFTGTPANCNSWHLVKAGEDCGTLESKYGISHSQFLQYNPAVSKDCVSNFWPNYAYCVGLGPPITTTSQTTTTTSTSSFNSTYSVRHPVTSWVISTPTVDNTTWPPTKTQAGQPSFCNNWHLVSGNQDCRAIWYMYSTWMTMADFFAWNPTIGTDCSGLFVNYYVCVGIQPQTGLTIALPTAANITLPPYVSWTPQPLPPVNSSFTPTPSQGPMPTNCVNFHKAEPGNTCDNILAEHREITRDQFFGWNPVLAGNCNGLWANNYYCVGAYSDGNLPQPPTVNTKPSPVPPDSAANCVAWYKTTDGDTCADISTMFGSFTDKDFKAWNPAVGGNCSGLRVGYWYCVAVPGTPTTRTTRPSPSTASPDTSTTSSTKALSTTSLSTSTTSRPATTTSEAPISTPQPIQAPMTAGCRRFYFVKPGDGCWQISHDAGITIEDFYKWNPGAAPDCSGMWANVYVCVGIAGPAATFSGTPPKPT